MMGSYFFIPKIFLASFRPSPKLPRHTCGPIDAQRMKIAALEPERLAGCYSHAVFKSSYIIGGCMVSMKVLAPKVEALRTKPETKIAIFFRTVVTIFIQLQQSVKTIAPNKTI
jgi:hypothetical protein